MKVTYTAEEKVPMTLRVFAMTAIKATCGVMSRTWSSPATGVTAVMSGTFTMTGVGECGFVRGKCSVKRKYRSIELRTPKPC